MTTRTTSQLSLEQCWRLLQRSHVGRLAFIDRGGVFPLIIPVNYLVLDQVVVFHAGPGPQLSAALRGAPVTFEVDATSEAEQSGWTVVLSGYAEELLDHHRLAVLSQRRLQPWTPEPEEHYLRLNASGVSGRRVLPRGSTEFWWDPSEEG